MARLAIGIGMGLAGIGGMLVGLDTSIDPLVGFRAILSVFAAAVVGGLGSIPGAVVGGLAIGLAEELSLLALPATYKSRGRVPGDPGDPDAAARRACSASARDMTNYLIAMATFGAIYAILALGLNVMWGMAGMVNLGIVGFYGFGAYISALLTVKGHAPIALGFLAAMIGTAVDGGAGDARAHAAARRLSGDRHARLRRGRAHRRRERDLADQAAPTAFPAFRSR